MKVNQWNKSTLSALKIIVFIITYKSIHIIAEENIKPGVAI